MTKSDNLFDDLWENFKSAKGDEVRLELFKEAMIASKLVLEENGHNSRIIYELLLELERLKDGFSQGPTTSSSPSLPFLASIEASRQKVDSEKDCSSNQYQSHHSAPPNRPAICVIN